MRNQTRQSAVCIVSGGLDSVCTAAYLARERNADLYVLTFAYGQRAEREIGRAAYFANVLKAKDHKTLDIGFMKSLYGTSNALTDTNQELSQNFAKSLVVPVRNAVFLVIASAWAFSINARLVAYGAHSGDVVHYPDCRPEFAESIAKTLNLAESDGIASGWRQPIQVWSPAAAGMSKADLLKVGYSILGDRLFEAWSCYTNGVKAKARATSSKTAAYLHCGVCESCINRKVAFTSAGIEDKTDYATGRH
jgi:7-cyano-7-deazaguanine synthase